MRANLPDRFPWLSRVRAFVLGGVALTVLALPNVSLAQDPNECDQPGESPDVIVGDVSGAIRWGTENGLTAFSFGTDSCNVGTCWLDWYADSVNHPVIGQNLYRLRDGRFEQLGQSWLKHGFLALALNLCSNDCIDPPTGQHLGVNCSDPYWAGLNGDQNGLGPKHEVNASTGEFIWPAQDLTMSGGISYKRVQVRNFDLDPDRNPGATYYAEGQYVTADDAAAGNQNNNASYRQTVVSGQDGIFQLTMSGPTVRESPAIQAWIDSDHGILSQVIDVPGDGRFIVASSATELDHGYWQYEYAVHNLNSHRSARTFVVDLAPGVDVTNPGFHDVDYHSGEPYDGTDWTYNDVTVGGGRRSLSWVTSTFAQDPNANALRWGTLYNFRYSAKAPPVVGQVSLGLFRPGTPSTLQLALHAPDPCDGDGTCEAGETCANCAEDCVDQGGGSSCCGDTVCSPGESPCTCEADCGPCTLTCSLPSECDDGVFCNGVETCDGSVCQPGAAPCPGEYCIEATGSCGDCLVDDHCDDESICDGVDGCVDEQCVPVSFPCTDDGVFCNGPETCGGDYCIRDIDPCPDAFCDEAIDSCVICYLDEHCDDGQFCNGTEACVENLCVPGVDPCDGEPCDEVYDVCPVCTLDEECGDGVFCNGQELCLTGECAPALLLPCAALCLEASEECVGNVFAQPPPGSPLLHVDAGELARFEAGRQAFESAHLAAAGLGPVYNDVSCAACHATQASGAGDGTVTHFGFRDEVGPTFDPLTSLGGSLLQAHAVQPGCEELVPPEANHSSPRIATTTHGLGLVESVSDADLTAREISPPSGVSGRTRTVSLLELPGETGIGRFGWQASSATILSATARETVDQLGITNRLLPDEHAPNGDAVLLASCDPVSDPEDGPDLEGFDLIDRVSDYLRFLAPPSQTPRSGMTGEVFFVINGCGKCHVATLTTADDPALSPALRDTTLKPYSDFLLHDMGAAGDAVVEVGAQPGEVRTAPLWGLAARDRLWHDGRISGGTLEDRILAAIQEHAAPGSEGAASAASFLGEAPAIRNYVLQFLASLGRREFDADADGDLDAADWAAFHACFTGPGGSIGPNDPCAVSDLDRDGDVDGDDEVLFPVVLPGPPAGDTGGSLRIDRGTGDRLALFWEPSCAPADDDFAVYEGSLGSFASHVPAVCTTGAATSIELEPSGGDRYFLVVPLSGAREGSQGADSAGAPRTSPVVGCLPREFAGCP